MKADLRSRRQEALPWESLPTVQADRRLQELGSHLARWGPFGWILPAAVETDCAERAAEVVSDATFPDAGTDPVRPG